MKINKKRLIIINIALISILGLFVAVSLLLDSLDVRCALASNAYMYCPGCGGTRAVWSMLRLDFLSALRYNIVVPMICILYIYY
ncbi:MAG: DUF2752 domain-containing protein, partial [Clostridia bacterium]|nr:DUF2752 domain-containing protein [Clostridia bacterium]